MGRGLSTLVSIKVRFFLDRFYIILIYMQLVVHIPYKI